jgi:O-antigen ligase
MPAGALGCLLLFATLAFAATEQWALSLFQIGVFALGTWCSVRRRMRFYPVAILLAAVVAWAGIQCLAGWTVYRFATVNALVNWAAYFTLFVAAGLILESQETRRRFLRAALYAGFAICVLSTAQYFTSGGAIYWIFRARAGRPFGPFVNPDHYAVFVELILPLAIHESLRDKGKVWLHTAMAAVFYASVIASASRAGAALVTVEMLALPLIEGRTRMAGRTIAISVLFAGLATTAVGWDVLWKRFHDNDPFRYRKEIAVSTLQMIRQRPWTGFGLGNYANVYPEFASFDLGLAVDHAHNDWAEWAAEGGIPMLLLMLGIAAIGLRPAIRSVWGLGIYAVFLHSLVDFPMQIPALAALVFTFLAALRAPSRNSISGRRNHFVPS